MKVKWNKFDYTNKDLEPKPPVNELVWIVESHYLQGPGLGYFDGFTFRTWIGTDDCSVKYWAEIEYPDCSAEWAELEKQWESEE